MTFNIALCTEANSFVGMGHAVRCAGLLRLIEIPFKLTVIGIGETLREFFIDATHVQVDNWVTLDPAKINKSYDLLIADIPFYRPRDWNKLRIYSSNFVVIDDHGGSIPADVIINGTILPEYHNYDNAHTSINIYKGAHYSLVRPEFSMNPWKGPDSSLVSILVGSGDKARDWIIDIAKIGASQFNVEKVKIIVNRNFDTLNILHNFCKKGNIELYYGLSAIELADTLSNSTAALVTAGTGLYEAISTGVPVVAYPQIFDLVKEAAWFANLGACYDLTISQPSPITASKAINSLVKNKNASIEMNKLQSLCLDGKGMIRAAKILSDILRNSK